MVRSWWILFSMVASVSAQTTYDSLILERVASGLSNPLWLTAAPGFPDHVFIVEQRDSQAVGRVKVLDLKQGNLLGVPFLEVPGVNTAAEEGLLGMVFHPAYAVNRQFYVYYTVQDPSVNPVSPYSASRIVRYTTMSGNAFRADPASATTILTFPQPFRNHNGGWMAFGPDGFLHIATGDGGSGNNDPLNASQSLNDNPATAHANESRLGKILRIDVDRDDYPGDSRRNYGIPSDNPFAAGGGAPEIWAYGLRNPWRPSFDRATGDLWIGDVGQGRREEINFQPASSDGGENYGWRVFEGTLRNNEVSEPDPVPRVNPVWEYGRSVGWSVIGGYVYRGGAIPWLRGNYVFGDFGSGFIRSFRLVNGTVTDHRDWTELLTQSLPAGQSLDAITSFGEDTAGELYVIDRDGDVFRLAQASSGPTPLHLDMGHLSIARYDGIPGKQLADLHAASSFPDDPDSVVLADQFEFEGGGNNFGVYAWAWLVPDRTGDYTFWIASDDEGFLSLSPDADSTNATIIARVPGHTRKGEYDRYPEQRSATLRLTAGKSYYIEAQMKQGWSDVNLSVAWQGPGFSRQIIPGRVLGLPFDDRGSVFHPVVKDGEAHLALYHGIPGWTLDDLFASEKFPDSPNSIQTLEDYTGAASRLSTWIAGQNLGIYSWAWYVPNESGPHRFRMSSDDQGELWMSHTAEPAGAVPIASVPTDTGFERFNTYPEQLSRFLHLEQGHPYFLSAIVKQGWSDAHFSVGVNEPDGVSKIVDWRDITTTPGDAAWGAGGPPLDALERGKIYMARYNGVGGDLLSALRNAPKFPQSPDNQITVPRFQHSSNAINFGLFTWGWLIPDVSGDYRFWLQSDNQGELYLSPNADSAGARLIARVETFVAPHQFDKFAAQRSDWITLEAGHAYYLAGLVKQGWGGALLTVSWEGPGIARQVIPGHVLALPTYDSVLP